jgi:two-component system NtrC family sensor kinase
MRVAQDNQPGDSKGREAQALKELQGLIEVVSQGKEAWETAFDAIVDPVLIVSKEYVIQRSNLAAADSAGSDVREVIGKHCYEIFAKRHKPCADCPMGEGQARNVSERTRLQPFSDGREFAVSSFPIRDKADQDTGLSVMQYQDMSGIRKLEDQLVQNEKMAALGHFASGIAHDINNPLSGVLAFAQLAMQGVEKNSQVYEDLKEIEHSALRCKQIIEDLLLLSKPIEKSDREMIDLSQIVKKVLPSLEVQWKSAPYKLVTELKPLPLVPIHAGKFAQVFTNILMNAFQAISENGEIRIECGEDEKRVYVDISDNGEGISEKNLKNIFDPYFTTKKKSGGTGLGLPVTYNIVREHGGHIEVKSKVGEGTSFKVYVPKGGTP